jgi:hypothetical protein
MRCRVLAVLVVALMGWAAGAAQARDGLVVRRAVVLPDRRLVVLDVRCRAAIERCVGELRAATADGVAVTARRHARLPFARSRRIALRLLPDGLRRLASGGSPATGRLVLADRAGRSLAGDFDLEARASCQTGSTLAATGRIRVFRLLAFGVYACSRPTGRPMLLAQEDDSLVLSSVQAVQIAGPYVALSTATAWKCRDSAVQVADIRARRVVRQRRSQTTMDNPVHGCLSTTSIVDLVLRPSGAIAWPEAPGDTGEAAVRALDDAGDRTLDVGPDVDPGSLQLVGRDEVSWTRAGQLQTAALR